MGKVIRVDEEVFAILMDLKVRLEVATGRPCSINRVLAFLVALRWHDGNAEEGDGEDEA